MNDKASWLADRFEEHRAHLVGVAYRMLGSRAEADDAVQEAWLRASRADSAVVENLGGWLTTIVSRVALDMLRSRSSRREEFGEDGVAERRAGEDDDPERQAMIGDAVSAALMVVLDALNPAERVAFVLHDLFEIPFEQIAPIIGKSVVATRQLASRARRRVRLVNADATIRAQDEIVSAFLAAAREGDFETLLRILAPTAVLRADATAASFGTQPEVRGSQEVVQWFSGRAKAAQPALVDGVPGLVWVQAGELRVAFAFTFDRERVTAIDLIADPTHLTTMDIAY